MPSDSGSKGLLKEPFDLVIKPISLQADQSVIWADTVEKL